MMTEKRQGAALRRCFGTIVPAAFLLTQIATYAHAMTLTDTLARLYTQNRIIQDPSGNVSVPGGFADALGPVIEKLAPQGTNLPAASTAPGLSFEYDPDLQVMLRVASLGPIFTERAWTVGKGHLHLGWSGSYAELDELDGHGNFGALLAGARQRAQRSNGEFLDVTQRLTIDRFRLKTTIVNVYATYGLTDAWDLNLLLPLVNTDLDARATREVFDTTDPSNPVRIGPVQRGVPARGNAFGVGDLLLRTKYRLPTDRIATAVTLALRFPTGEEGDFHGFGDWIVTPGLVASTPLFKRHSAHLAVDFNVNADDLERSRVGYALGVAINALDNLAVLVEIIGSSGIADDEFTVSNLVRPSTTDPFRGISFVGVNSSESTLEVTRTDIVDLSTSIKWAITDHALVYAGAAIPLTNDGLRASVIPNAGIEIPLGALGL